MDAKSRIGNKLTICNAPFTLSTWHFSLDSITVKVCLANKPNVSTGSTRWTLFTVSSARLTGSQVMTFINSLDDIHILDEQWSSFQSSSRRWKVTTWVLSSYRKLLGISEGCEARDHVNRKMKWMNTYMNTESNQQISNCAYNARIFLSLNCRVFSFIICERKGIRIKSLWLNRVILFSHL